MLDARKRARTHIDAPNPHQALSTFTDDGNLYSRETMRKVHVAPSTQLGDCVLVDSRARYMGAIENKSFLTPTEITRRSF